MDGDTHRTAAENPASDAELAQRARGGGPDADAAFAVLHNRHHGAALRHARRLEPDADAAEDLVSDAFVEVLAQLRRGGGPRESFRAYLCTTMRNSHADRAQARRTVVPTDEVVLDSLGGSAPQTADALPDLLMVKQAFGSLPDRWQAILWHTEVEGEKPRHIARLLGMTPNAVSQLAVRAREGLCEAFLKAHIGRLPERCRTHGERLGGYVRGTLRIRDRRAVDDHLADCPICTRLCAELVATNAHLRVLLLPAILGGTAATALTAEALAGGVAAAGAGSTGTGTAGTGTAGTGTVGTGTATAGPAATGPTGAGPTATPSGGATAGPGVGPVPAAPAPTAPAPGGAPAGSGLPDAVGKVGLSVARKTVVGSMIAAAAAAAIALATVLPGDAKPSSPTEKRADLIAEPAVPVPPPGPAQPAAVPPPPPGPTKAPSTPPGAPPNTPPNTLSPGRPEPSPSGPAASPVVPPPGDTGPSAAPTAAEPATDAPVTGSTTSPPPTTGPPPSPSSTVDPTATTRPTAQPTTPPTTRPTTQPTTPPGPVAAMAVDDSATVRAGGTVSLNLLANDRGDGLRIVGSRVAWGLYGWISCDRLSGACTYRAWTPLFTGTDVFHYTVRDSRGQYASAVIRITVAADRP